MNDPSPGFEECLLMASPTLFTLLIKARNELALLGNMAPVSKLCLEIDNAINDVRGDASGSSARSR